MLAEIQTSLVSCEAKKEQLAHMSSGLQDHYCNSELFTKMAALNFKNTVAQLLAAIAQTYIALLTEWN